MATKRKAPVPPVEPVSRDEWALAFARRATELRGELGRKYLATIVATLYPKHGHEDAEAVAVRWAAEHESKGR